MTSYLLDATFQQPRDDPGVSRTYVVANETNRKVVVKSTDGDVFMLDPLETRTIGDQRDVLRFEHDVVRFTLNRWRDYIRIEAREVEKRAVRVGVVTTTGVAVLVIALFWGLVGLFADENLWWQAGWAVMAAALAAAAAIDAYRSRPEKTLKYARSGLGWVRSWGGQQLYLLGSFAIGVVIPAATIFFVTDIEALWNIVRSQEGTAEHDALLTLIARAMQIVFVWIAALLPALLFFLFDRDHLDTLRNRFIRQIMRLDPSIDTRSAALQKYGDVMNEAYGRDPSGRILPGRRSPLLLATSVTTLGWMLTLLHGDLTLIRADANIIHLFEPRSSAVTYAFLGAYFYGINAILRGYIRKDLRPKTYSTLTVRILIVVVLAWVFDLQWNGNALLVGAFLAGLVPETALVLIKESGRALLGFVGRRFDELEEHDPLTNLEGIDLYDRARLFDEGVTNVESLAHHDLVELMLQTRIPVPRLVDWVDQAILYLHAGPRGMKNSRYTRTKALETLREYGIRTATDLDNAFEAAQLRKELRPLLTILDSPENDGRPSRLRSIKDAIDDDEWMVNLRHWRDPRNAVPEPVHLPPA